MTPPRPVAHTPVDQPVPGKQLIDNHNRVISYLRLAITDRCNLRCRYCMPKNGNTFVPHAEILSFEEMERLVKIFTAMGVTKLRVTGGEPFVRKDTIPFLKKVSRIDKLGSIHITTNGVATADHLDTLKELGIAGINLSLDTLDKKRFWKITRHDFQDKVLRTFNKAIALGIPLKINTVIQDGINSDEIIPIARLAGHHPVEVRFIEQMPFSGDGPFTSSAWNSDRIFAELKNAFPEITPIDDQAPTTARLFSVPGFPGRIGIIGGYSRLFCSRCNKIRITPLGVLKTCLYDGGAVDLRNMLRSGANDSEIEIAIRSAIADRAANGFLAEAKNNKGTKSSMATIGG